MDPTLVTQSIDVPSFVYTDTGNALLIAVHAVAFVVAAFFAYRAFSSDTTKLFAWGFTLYAIAEISYVLYHVSVTSIMLSHIVSEVLDLVAFILVFSGITQNLLTSRKSAPSTARA